ncbi:MAG: DUF349 domain-containing protein [Bacteroidaceae bacterium]|nr:DUF349 domain-containing protein [Bacteroidaceae bacterium]
MTETNELQPTPEVEAQAAEVQTAPAPTPETQAEETIASAEKPADEPAAQAPEPQAEAEAEEAEKVIYTTKEQVVERLQAITAEGQGGEKAEIDLLKQVFYKLHRADQLAARNAYIEAGGDPEQYKPEIDVAEENFKSALAAIRARRAELAEAQEQQKTDNLNQKQSIIDRIKELAASPEEANIHFDEFKQLQAKWKEIGSVPAEKATEIWKNYQLYVEQFYDQLKLHIEAREYDFKKNLEAKTRLIEAAEKLADETDIITAFNKLQALHADYKEIGPVAKDLRDSIWERFKAASTVINKRHQEHFEAIKAREEENLQKKTELCERAEDISLEGLNTFAAWDEKTKEVLALQAEWKTIGFAPQKMNQRVFDRFRVACDRFFTAKADFFKNIKDEQASNLEAKRRLADEAEALQDSTEWRKTSDKLIELQKQWKAIGAVPRKYSEQLWKRFSAACDKFFEAKNAANADTRAEEKANLQTKRSIIDQLRELAQDTANATIDKVRDLQQQWNETGHVPFRDKDKLYAEYRELADRLYKEFGQSQARRRLEGFQKSIKKAIDQGGNALSRERERLMRIYDQQKAELQNYETNLNFLNAKSKSGNSLVAEMNKKVEKLHGELELLKQKIKAVETEMRAPKAEEKAAEAPAEAPASEQPAAAPAAAPATEAPAAEASAAEAEAAPAAEAAE